MRSALLFSLASALALTGINAENITTGALGDALVVTGNPAGVTYFASTPENNTIRGNITATAGPNGRGVHFVVNFSNLPPSSGPISFAYHIHAAPVNSSGSCASTLAHLDPFIRTQVPACSPDHPATCEVGDLSGKWGKVNSDPYTNEFTDPYLSILEGPGSFFGNRSFVLHGVNSTRLACGNFHLVSTGNSSASGSNGTNGNGGNGGINGTAIAGPTQTTAPITGGASTMMASAVGMFGIFAAAAVLL